jgi:pyruvate/2-oxoglutarate dehydrogenase complex dihydrolipoamide dehydrogenase (E3) component
MCQAMGWDEWSAEGFNWDTMVENVDNYVSGMQYGYQNQLRDNAVEYINAVASFADAHSVNYTDVDGKTAKTVSSERFIVAVGGRPNYPTIPGAQLALTSDDIFWWKKAVGKTLVIGGSYIALECAGFLQGLGFDTTVMVRSILLRGFDQQCARQIGDIM